MVFAGGVGGEPLPHEAVGNRDGLPPGGVAPLADERAGRPEEVGRLVAAPLEHPAQLLPGEGSSCGEQALHGGAAVPCVLVRVREGRAEPQADGAAEAVGKVVGAQGLRARDERGVGDELGVQEHALGA